MILTIRMRNVKHLYVNNIVVHKILLSYIMLCDMDEMLYPDIAHFIS